ncbi:MAG: prolyl oligopeptidase family serine peptidase [Acidobacteriota bacterium]
MTIERHAFHLDAGDGLVAPIDGVVHAPPPRYDGRRAAVLIAHGFKGFMDWGFFPALADLLAERGFVAVRFNFPGSGMRPGDALVTDLDAFRDTTFLRERDEILAMLDRLRASALPLANRTDAARIGLVGHSRGGGTAVLAAASDAGRDALRALVTWNAVGTFQRFPEAVRDRWREDGQLPVQNGRTGQTTFLGLNLLDEIENEAEALDLDAAAARRTAPWLIVHGSEDATVPVDEAHRLYAAASGDGDGDGDDAAAAAALEVIAGSGHTFEAKHPFACPTPALIHAMNHTQRWLRRHLA